MANLLNLAGISPINSVKTAGVKGFYSIFEKTPKYDGYSSAPRPYITTRGMLVAKSGLRNLNPANIYYFQFNPETINDTKETLYESRNYTGLAYNDYIWSGGGERTISFELFLDDTQESKGIGFRPFTYNQFGELTDEGELAKTKMNENKESSTNINSPQRVEDVLSFQKLHKRGILDEVEKIQSFLYPAPLAGEATPKFASGGIISDNQFRAPETAVLAIGPIYLEGVVKSAPVTFTLFDSELTPVRGTINLEFSVFEFCEVTRQFGYDGKKL